MDKNAQKNLDAVIKAFDYKSPVEIIAEQVQMDFNDGVYKAVQSYGVNVDKDELERALRYDRGQYDTGFKAGAIEFSAQLIRKIFPYDVVDKKEYSINAYAVYRAIVDLAGDFK